MEYIKLRDICNTTQGIQISKEEQIEKFEYGYIRYLYIADFKNDDNKKFVINNYSEKIVTESDLVMANTGSPGAVFKGINGVLSNNLFKISLDKSIIDRDFLYYYLSSKKFQDNLKERLKGGVQKHLGHKTIGEQLIPVIDLSSQKKIVNVLDKAQGIINKRKEQIEALDELVKSQFIEMFGDPVKNTKGWNKCELREGIQEIKYGTSTPPVFSEEGIPFIRATNIKVGRIIENDIKYISEDEARKIEKCKLALGDTIIVRSGANTGDNAFVSEKYVDAYGGYDIIVKLNEKINYIFLNALLNSVYRDIIIQPLTRRAGQPHLNSEQIQSLVIFTPPIELQNKFADFVEQVDKLKFEMQNSLKELEDNFNSLMQRAFKGELF